MKIISETKTRFQLKVFEKNKVGVDRFKRRKKQKYVALYFRHFIASNIGLLSFYRPTLSKGHYVRIKKVNNSRLGDFPAYSVLILIIKSSQEIY